MPAPPAAVNVTVHASYPPLGQCQSSIKPTKTSATSLAAMIVTTPPHLCNVGDSNCRPLPSPPQEFNTTNCQLLTTPTEYPPLLWGSTVTIMAPTPPSYDLAMALSPSPSERAASLYMFVPVHQLVHMSHHHTPQPVPISLTSTTPAVSTSALTTAPRGKAASLYIFLLIHQPVHMPLAGQHIPPPVPTTITSTISAVSTPSPNPAFPSPLPPSYPPRPGRSRLFILYP
ncbi:hypothetical protein DFS34DRAFT_644909 [Phlyctochytrium arcticum]|nr:hypothetical protein DFS34DRAFT_644909 [Phlyctochytrium arcticum]